MKDVLLSLVDELAQADEANESGITLLVDGFLVSGYVVSLERYLRHHPFPKYVLDELTKQEQSNPSSTHSQSGSLEQRFIHLRDARYFAGQNPAPTDQGVYCRIKLESVSAFHFGVLQVIG